MDQLKDKLSQLLKKYKFAAFILALGLVLMAFPSLKEKNQQAPVITEPMDDILSLEEELSEILATIHGAGKVKVMLTVSMGEETVYQTNDSSTANPDSSSLRTDTVTVSDPSRSETGLVRQVIPPEYLGALIVCQGADSPVVRLHIIEAVAKLTGLSTDRISVLKMK